MSSKLHKTKTMEMNYAQLKKWIYHDPRVVNFRRFCLAINVKQQNICYYLKTKRPMPKYIIDDAQKVFGLSNDEVNRYFYLVKGCKKNITMKKTMIIRKKTNCNYDERRNFPHFKKLRNIYLMMINRCNSDYRWKDIKVCDKWLGVKGFTNFYDWAMANGYKDEVCFVNGKMQNKWTLDRIDTNGNYEPSNCRWTTWDIQNHNKDYSTACNTLEKRHAYFVEHKTFKEYRKYQQ